MKNLLLIIGFLIPNVISGQQDCFDTNGEYDNDEPPGCMICDNIITSTTEGRKVDDFTFDFPCGTIENSQWFSIFPSIDGVIEISIVARRCDNEKGIEAVLYDKDFNLVSDCKIIEFISVLKAENLQSDVHYLMIDGIDADICEFSIFVNNNNLFDDFSVSVDEIRVNQELPFCLGSEVCFTIDPVAYASSYIWTTPIIFPVLGGGELQDTFICLEIVDYYDGQIAVQPIGPCGNGQVGFSQFEVGNFTMEIVDTVICEGECIQIRDSCFTGLGKFNFLVKNKDEGCDTLVKLTIRQEEVFPSPFINCRDSSGYLFLNWEKESGVDEFEVFVNRDSITTVTDNFVLLKDLPVGIPLRVKVQPKGICSYLPGETTCFIQVSTIEEDFLKNKISVFPNPTTGFINLETDLQIEEIEIYDTSGRILQKENTTSFELKNRESGIYFFKIKTNEGVGVKRIMVSSK